MEAQPLLFVADSGMDSLANRKILAPGGGKYLLAVRAGSVKEVKTEVPARPGRYKVVANHLQVKEIEVGDGVLRRRYFLCFNPHEAARHREHREMICRIIQQELERHPDWNAPAKWAVEMIASRRTGKYLRVNAEGKLFLDPLKVKAAEKFDGKGVLITNDDTRKPEDAARGYKSLLVIEQCFRTLKSTRIHLTPINHWLPHRIESHVKICVLSLWIQRIAERTCGRNWSWISHTLNQLEVAEYSTPTHRFFRRNQPTSEVVALLKALDILMPHPVLGIAARAS